MTQCTSIKPDGGGQHQKKQNVRRPSVSLVTNQQHIQKPGFAGPKTDIPEAAVVPQKIKGQDTRNSAL